MITARRKLVAGNWKLHLGITDSRRLASTLRARLAGVAAVDVVLAPVFTALRDVHEVLSGSSIGLASQDVYWQAQGAFTGEVSAPLLKDVGCSHGIVGHSERRQYFGETEETVARKTAALLAHDIVPIVCVGETLEQREGGKTFDVVRTQVVGALSGLTASQIDGLVVAYEPVWAIGTGRNASPGDAQEVHAFLRARLGELAGEDVAARVRILYGGSVKPDNAAGLMGQPDIDGALVGGASLNADSFESIVRASD